MPRAKSVSPAAAPRASECFWRAKVFVSTRADASAWPRFNGGHNRRVLKCRD